MTTAKLIFISDTEDTRSQETVLNTFIAAAIEDRVLEAGDVAQMQDIPLQQVQQDIAMLQKNGHLQVFQGILLPTSIVPVQMS